MFGMALSKQKTPRAIGSGRTDAKSVVPPEFGRGASTLDPGNGGSPLHPTDISGQSLEATFPPSLQGLAPNRPLSEAQTREYSSSAQLLSSPAAEKMPLYTLLTYCPTARSGAFAKMRTKFISLYILSCFSPHFHPIASKNNHQNYFRFRMETLANAGGLWYDDHVKVAGCLFP